MTKTIAAIGLMLALGGMAAGTRAETIPALPEAAGSVEIKRDRYGTPHVYSDTVYGLFYGYGYAVAEDRLFQLEMARRASFGTASEILGPEVIPVDEMSRFEVDRESISRQLDKLPARHRDALAGYAAGFSRRVAEVNADPEKLLPKEFSELGFRPEAWSALDVAVTFSASMINRFSGPSQELENLELYHGLRRLHGAEKAWRIFRSLHWINDPTSYTTAPADQWRYAHAIEEPETLNPLQEALVEDATRPIPTFGYLDLRKDMPPGETIHTWKRQLLAMNGISGRGGFASESNTWLINGARTKDAKAILISGPQVGWTAPSYFYNIGLHGAGFNVVSSALLGLPFLLTGYNGSVGWSVTAAVADQVDMFEEKLNPDDPETYLHNGKWKRFAIRKETLPVKGGAAREILRRVSVHGPVVAHDPAKGIAYSKRRAWDGYELQTLGAWLDMAAAKTAEEFDAATKRVAVNLNIYRLDAKGNIGYQMAGFYPRRVPGHDLRLPAVGTGEMDWLGLHGSEASPTVKNPSTGFIANWNNKPGSGWPNGDQWWAMWSGAHHVRILVDALSAKDDWTPRDAWGLIRHSSHADHNLSYFLPYLREAVAQGSNETTRAALAALEAWDGQWRDDDGDGMFDGPGPALIETFLDRLYREVIADDVGETGFSRFSATTNPVREILVGSDMPPGSQVVIYNLSALEGKVPLAYDLFNGEPPLEVIRRTFEATVSDLATKGGRDPSAWRIAAFKPRFHVTTHLGIRFGSAFPRRIPAFQNRGASNLMFWADGTQLHGVGVLPLGQSGMIYPDGRRAAHYADQQDIYDRFDHIPLPVSAPEVEALTVSRTQLHYGPSSQGNIAPK